MAKGKGYGATPMPANDYQQEDDHRTLTRAAEVRGAPKRMAGVRQHHEKQRRALGAVGRSLGGRRR